MEVTEDSTTLQKNTLEKDELLKKLKARLADNLDFQKLGGLFDDKFLLGFIRGRKYDLDKAHATLESFMRDRTTKYPQLFRPMIPSTVKSLDSGCFRGLKHQDNLQRAVLIDRVKLWNPNLHSAEDALRTLILFSENSIGSEKGLNGVVLIFDLSGFDFNRSREFTLERMLLARDVFYKSFPLQYKECHVINGGFFFTSLFKTGKYILPQKIRQRVFIHKDAAGLFKYVSASILPKSLGGTVPDEEAFDVDFEKEIKAKEDYYQKISQLI